MAFLLAIAISWAAMRVTDVSPDRIRFVLAAEHADLSSSESASPLVNKMIKIVIFVFAIAAILGTWGYNTTTVLRVSAWAGWRLRWLRRRHRKICSAALPLSVIARYWWVDLRFVKTELARWKQ